MQFICACKNNCKSCQIYLDLQRVFSKSIECITNKILLLFSLNNNNISMYVADRENTTNLKNFHAVQCLSQAGNTISINLLQFISLKTEVS
uniref:Uncharacterized protein n=1 Tax=Anguilla anguilla TaxID=7936 RepID=A0A0E9R557_ANGAN